METSRGVVKVTITSAEPLKKKTLESIQSAVVSMAGAGKTVSYFCNKYIIVFL
jgi:F0F1-type ATP synthase delta subunit